MNDTKHCAEVEATLSDKVEFLVSALLENLDDQVLVLHTSIHAHLLDVDDVIDVVLHVFHEFRHKLAALVVRGDNDVVLYVLRNFLPCLRHRL